MNSGTDLCPGRYFSDSHVEGYMSEHFKDDEARRHYGIELLSSIVSGWIRPSAHWHSDAI